MDTTHHNIGVLLINLGTPDAPTPQAVKKYLSQFLHDKRVVDMSRWLWCPILHGIILPRRSPKVAKLYQAIWTEQGSPLLAHSLEQKQALQALLNIPVELGMTYGTPSIQQAVTKLVQKGCNKLIILPLYPQFSNTTTEAARDAFKRLDSKLTAELTTHWIENYHDHPAYIQALAESVQAHWKEYGESDYLLCSYHGIPQRYADNGDPYPKQCEKTTQLLAKALNLESDKIGMSYQSRFGREPWVMPYTDEVLKQLPQQGKSELDIITPAFASDCLETLEEIAVENRGIFMQHGGQQYRYISCLNNRPLHIKMMGALVEQAMGSIIVVR